MKEESSVSESRNRTLPGRVLSGIKRTVTRLCGKARWIVLALAVYFALTFFFALNLTMNIYCYGVKDDNYVPIIDTPMKEAVEFAVNSSGFAAIGFDIGRDGMTALMNIDSGEKTYANIGVIKVPSISGEYARPYSFAMTDDNVLYAVAANTENGSLITQENVIRISRDHKYLGDVCKIKYAENEHSVTSKLSRLHYYNGKVTFALVEEEGVKLYSVDTETNALSVSDRYANDPDGTYTSVVIPIDGAFLFLRSDGNVYKAGFGEPLGESIFKMSSKGELGSSYFSEAVMCGGKLYVADSRKPDDVFCLEDGALKKVFDIHEAQGTENSSVKRLASYRPAGSDKDVLVICLDNGLLTYSDGQLINKDIIIHTDRYIWMILDTLTDIVFFLLILALIINLIIRKKTLLFKQLITTIPVLMAVTLVITVKLYNTYSEQNTDNIEKEVSIICNLGAAEFRDYDFSPLLEMNSNTGAAYEQLREKLEGLGNNSLHGRSGEYLLSIVCRTDDGRSIFLARNDLISVPMFAVRAGAEDDMPDNSKSISVVKDIGGLMSDTDHTDSISAYGKISAKGGDGSFFLKVRTEPESFWHQRRDFLIQVGLYFLMIFAVMTALITLLSLYITRNIKKAGKAVERISEGDLTARIKYKSRDELGEICSKVNAMGQSLETLFEEKDKTESFYYKFVPEKFREFLGKERFTDLSLGDASSRELTVLFCDIRSFSINSEMMTAKENFSFVNVIYGKAGPIIRENNGFVDKYIGDAVMALFEKAEDAVKAGTELYRAIVLDPHTAEELNVRDINIGIGIHTGMAMIGIVGESERLSGTVISDTVNLSSRLESLTKQYKTGMLISKDTVDRIPEPESLGLRYLGMVQVAGVNEVKAVYEALDCLPDEEREKRSANTPELREAIRLFHLGRRAEAVSELKALSDKGMNDHVTDMYLGYISGLSDDDSGNVFRFVRK